jgi:hypothetical protein
MNPQKNWALKLIRCRTSSGLAQLADPPTRPSPISYDDVQHLDLLPTSQVAQETPWSEPALAPAARTLAQSYEARHVSGVLCRPPVIGDKLPVAPCALL